MVYVCCQVVGIAFDRYVLRKFILHNPTHRYRLQVGLYDSRVLIYTRSSRVELSLGRSRQERSSLYGAKDMLTNGNISCKRILHRRTRVWHTFSHMLVHITACVCAYKSLHVCVQALLRKSFTHELQQRRAFYALWTDCFVFAYIKNKKKLIQISF